MQRRKLAVNAGDQFGKCRDRTGAKYGGDVFPYAGMYLGASEQPPFASKAPWEAELLLQSMRHQSDPDNATRIQRLSCKRWREKRVRNFEGGIAHLNDVSA
jgi:hypothetical protein